MNAPYLQAPRQKNRSGTLREVIMRAVLAILLSIVAASASPAERPVENRSEAAVIAADDAWSAAEGRGDANFVNWLLEPEYVSVGPDGKIHTKAAIVAGARSRNPANAKADSAKNAAWRAAHPYRTVVRIFGSTAVASFLSTKLDAGEPVNSSDIFVYREGHWHAIYSQHSNSGI